MKEIYLISFGLLVSYLCYSQPVELKPENDLASLLGGSQNTIKKATVQTESEKSMSVQIELTGFKEKEYKISATIMNAGKQIIKEIPKIEVPLDSRSGTTDFFFGFKQLPDKSYSQTFLESSYIQFTISEKEGFASGTGLDMLGIDSKIFIYKYKKKWPIKGGLGQEILVKLIPYKSASTLEPGK